MVNPSAFHPACRAAKRRVHYGTARENLNPRCRYRMLGPVTAPGLREKFKCRRRSILN